jgi:structural maintenance of chromosome 1
LDKINPNLKAIEKLGTVSARLDALNKDFDDAKNEAQNIGSRFTEIKKERYYSRLKKY